MVRKLKAKSREEALVVYWYQVEVREKKNNKEEDKT